MARPAPRRAPLPLVLLATLLVAGCGTQPAAPPSPFPLRPEPIDVSRLDPCAVLPAEESERLDLGEGLPYMADVNGTASPSCTWTGDFGPSYGYGAQAIMLNAAGAAAERGSRVIDVDGYGAVVGAPTTNNSPTSAAFCQIAIDVADGQSLRIQVDNGKLGTGTDPAALDAVCTEARRFGSVLLTAIRR